MDLESQLCRLCLIPVDPHSVVILNQAVDLIDSIFQITTVDVIVDSSRQVFICDQCQNTLDVSIQFRTMCLQNDSTFRKMFAKNALPMEQGLDNFAVEFDHFKVEDTSQDHENFEKLEPEISFQDNDFLDDQQHFSGEADCKKAQVPTLEPESQINNQGKNELSQTDKKKVRKHRKKSKTDLPNDHQDGQQSEKPSSLDETKKPRRKRIRADKATATLTKRRKVQCQICGSFLSREHLSKHLLTHSDVRPMYACELCPKKYPHKKNLKEHVEIVHEGTQQHICTVCGKAFSRKKRLDSHMNTTHTNVKKYACSACDEKFVSSGYRNYHFKVHHTNLRPYSCQYCHMTFKRSTDRTLHTRTHTGEKPYKCDLCDKRFAKSYNVVIHKKSHKNAELRLAAAQQKAENSDQNLNFELS